jgi:hypothetical protein
VSLEIEHIIPVKKGGTNDITNLLTSCKECNIGKSATLLDDYTLIENQYREIINQNKNIRKVKKMHMLKLFYDRNKEIECKVFEEELLRMYGIKLDENGRNKIKKIIRSYGILQIFETLDSLYIRDINDDKNFDLLLKQIKYDLKIKQKPYLKDLFYIRKILINKFNINSYIEKNELYKFIEAKLLDNYDKDTLISCALDCSNIRHFYKLVEGNKKEKNQFMSGENLSPTLSHPVIL